MNTKPDTWVSPIKVLKISRLIDQQIVLRTQMLCTLFDLKKAIHHRQVRGSLRQSDLDYIKHVIKKELKPDIKR